MKLKPRKKSSLKRSKPKLKVRKKLSTKLSTLSTYPEWSDEELEDFISNSYSGKYNNIDSKWSNFPFKPEMKYKEVIDNIDRLREVIEEWRQVPCFAFDTETNTLEVLGDNKKFRLVDITFSWGENNNYEIPLGHIRDEDIEADRNLDLEEVVELIKPIFENPNVMIVGHNLKFDLHVMRRVGIKTTTTKLFDTMLASWICDENTPNGLKENSAEKMSVPQTHFKEVTDSIPNDVKKKFGYKANAKVHDFGLVLIDDGAEYCIGDAFYTWCNFLGFRQEIIDEKMDKIYYIKMIPFLLVLLDMEERGTTVDVDRLKEMGEEMQKDLEKLQYRIYELAGCIFNIGSSPQKSLILFGIDDYTVPFNEYLEKYKKKNAKRLAKSKNGLDLDKVRKAYEEKQRDPKRIEILNNSFGFKVQGYTASGAPSTDNDTIFRLSQLEYKKNRRKQEGVEMCKAIEEYAKLEKLKTAFVDGILEQLYEDGKAHPSFNQCGTDSGRLSCIAEDTLIKCVGEDKPIQDVKVGDLVYCYDDNGNLQIKKVLNVMNNGVRPCVSVNWVSQGTHDFGSLICTPDHKILNHNLEWVRADSLSHNDKVVHLRRSMCYERPRLYGFNNYCKQEQLAIKNLYFNCYDSDICIHHKDGIKNKNYIDNLILMPKEEHTRLHSLELVEQGKIRTEQLRVPHKILSGKEHPRYKEVSVEYLERLVRESKGRIRDIPMDFDTFKKKCKEVGFDYKKVASEYQTQYREVSDEDFIKAFYECKGVPYAIHKKLNIGRTKVEKTIRRLDLCFNHTIDSVTSVGNKQVYDLEVEDCHNFIANEICVHNCSKPNLQQLPKAEEDAKYQIRSVFVGSEYYVSKEDGSMFDTLDEAILSGYKAREMIKKRKKIIAIDYHNLEMVCLTHFSHDKNLTEMFANDDDAHGSTAVNTFDLPCTPVECKKKFPHLRQVGKTLNFLLMYGGGANLLYEKLKGDHFAPLDLGGKEYLKQYNCRNGKEVAQVIIDKYFTTYSGVAQFISSQKKFAHKNGFVRTVLGRKRRLPDINSRDMGKSSYCERLSVNSAIQGTAGDITISAQLRVDSEEALKEMLCYMLIQIHDEIVLECPEEYLEEAIKIIKHDMEYPFGDNSRNIEFLRADYDFGDSYQSAK